MAPIGVGIPAGKAEVRLIGIGKYLEVRMEAVVWRQVGEVVSLVGSLVVEVLVLELEVA